MKIIRTTDPHTKRYGVLSKEFSQVMADFDTIEELDKLIKYNLENYEVVKLEYVEYE